MAKKSKPSKYGPRLRLDPVEAQAIQFRRTHGTFPQDKTALPTIAAPPVSNARVHGGADEDRVVANQEFWRSEYQRLRKDYNALLKEVAVVDRLVDLAREMAPTSYLPNPPFLPEAVNTAETPESAMLLFGDAHVGKKVDPNQTLGLSEYNFRVFLNRLKYLETRVISILRSHTTAPLDELVVAMLGDMLDGALSHGVEAGQANPLFDQSYSAAHAIAQFLRNLAAFVPILRIKTCVGNHTRWQNQKKMPTENRYSNLDMFLYAHIEALTRDIPNIQWSLDKQPFAVFEVQGFTFFAAHGDHWKGGDKAFGIPVHAMARQVNATTQLMHKYQLAVPHYYVSGHLHREIKIPTGLGDITVNGGFPGLDGYALSGNFNPVDPTQKFFRIHPIYGKGAEYSLALKFAPNYEEAPYNVPTTFVCS
jgi:hypothetical protein